MDAFLTLLLGHEMTASMRIWSALAPALLMSTLMARPLTWDDVLALGSRKCLRERKEVPRLTRARGCPPASSRDRPGVRCLGGAAGTAIPSTCRRNNSLQMPSWSRIMYLGAVSTTCRAVRAAPGCSVMLK